MNPISLLAWLGLALLGWFRRPRWRGRSRGVLEVAAGYRSLLRGLGLTEPEHFLALPLLTVSGHPDRNVSHGTLGEGTEAIPVYLKREHRVSWLVRLRNALAGAGLVSRSLRECHVLQALQREDLGCAEWIAAGEDGQGRAFLLLRAQAGARDLARIAREENCPRKRRELARRVGASLARLHHKGFSHPDLHAGHVLVCGTGDIILLDWQRARRSYQVSWKRRGRDLAALHVTLADGRATLGERWACLDAYLAETAQLSARTHLPIPRRRLLRRPEARLLLQGLEIGTRRCLRRRHMLEKRLQGSARQDWLRLDGEQLCVSSKLASCCPEQDPQALGLDRQPPPVRSGTVRRWLPVAGRGPIVLTRRSVRVPLAAAWTWLSRRRWSSPEQQQSVLLLRLQRHGVTVSDVLAMGQRHALTGRQDSFLLTAPLAGALRLDLWLTRQARQRTEQARAERRDVLFQAGVTVARLHQASCYLTPRANAGLLAVLTRERPLAVSLLRPEWLRPSRVCRPGQALRDYVRFRRLLIEAGCSAADLRLADLGYRQALNQPVGDCRAPGSLRAEEAIACPA